MSVWLSDFGDECFNNEQYVIDRIYGLVMIKRDILETFFELVDCINIIQFDVTGTLKTANFFQLVFHYDAKNRLHSSNAIQYKSH